MCYEWRDMDAEENWWLYGAVVCLHFLGLVVNCVLLVVVWRLRRLRCGSGFQLITGIGIGDTVSGMLGLGMSGMRAVIGDPVAFESVLMCRVFGMAGYLVYNLSGLLVSFLALERYLLVCHGYRVRMDIVWFVFVSACIFYSLPLVYKNGEFAADLTQNYCFPRGTSPLVYTVGVLTNVPLVALGFSYISIFIYHMGMENEFNSTYPRKVCHRALLVLILYFICYFPKLALTLVSFVCLPDSIPYFLLIIPPVGLAMVITINPILVLCLYNDFRVQALVLLRKLSPASHCPTEQQHVFPDI